MLDLTSIKTEQDIIKALKDKTQFERDVLVATFRIPKGKLSTYKRIAEKIGRPKLIVLLQMPYTRILFGQLFPVIGL